MVAELLSRKTCENHKCELNVRLFCDYLKWQKE